ncbi:hypothetical protein LguiB_007748 [Lonicera macranthoides]
MTISFCMFSDFFPGTGHILDIGLGLAKYHALNVPLNDGMDDESFCGLFKPIMQKVMQLYQLDTVVLQCGADSLAGDRLGCFNLSIKGHADCLLYLRSFNIPLMVLGGGGYTTHNTAVAVGVVLDNKLPYNEFYEYFGPDYTLHVEPSPINNQNSAKYLEKLSSPITCHDGLNHILSTAPKRSSGTELGFGFWEPFRIKEGSKTQTPFWNDYDYESDNAYEDIQPRHYNFSTLWSNLDWRRLDLVLTQRSLCPILRATYSRIPETGLGLLGSAFRVATWPIGCIGWTSKLMQTNYKDEEDVTDVHLPSSPKLVQFYEFL